MPKELQISHVTGKNVFFLLRSSVGTIWNGGTLETYASADFANYPIAATEQGTSGYYVADFPAALTTADIYSVVAKERAGGSPAETDLTIGDGDVFWSGSAVGVTIVSIGSSALGSIFTRNMSNDEGTAAKQSLCAAILKLASKFDVSGATADTYKTDGTTKFMSQSITHLSTATAIVTLGVGS